MASSETNPNQLLQLGRAVLSALPHLSNTTSGTVGPLNFWGYLSKAPLQVNEDGIVKGSTTGVFADVPHVSSTLPVIDAGFWEIYGQLHELQLPESSTGLEKAAQPLKKSPPHDSSADTRLVFPEFSEHANAPNVEGNNTPVEKPNQQKSAQTLPYPGKVSPIVDRNEDNQYTKTQSIGVGWDSLANAIHREAPQLGNLPLENTNEAANTGQSPHPPFESNAKQTAEEAKPETGKTLSVINNSKTPATQKTRENFAKEEEKPHKGPIEVPVKHAEQHTPAQLGLPSLAKALEQAYPNKIEEPSSSASSAHNMTLPKASGEEVSLSKKQSATKASSQMPNQKLDDVGSLLKKLGLDKTELIRLKQVLNAMEGTTDEAANGQPLVSSIPEITREGTNTTWPRERQIEGAQIYNKPQQNDEPMVATPEASSAIQSTTPPVPLVTHQLGKIPQYAQKEENYLHERALKLGLKRHYGI